MRGGTTSGSLVIAGGGGGGAASAAVVTVTDVVAKAEAGDEDPCTLGASAAADVVAGSIDTGVTDKGLLTATGDAEDRFAGDMLAF